MTLTVEPVSGWKVEEFLVRNQLKWMEVHVATKGSSLRLKINSSFGSMSYSWSHCGTDVDWRKWLLNTEFDYFMGKMLGRGYQEFSLEKTLEACLDKTLSTDGLVELAEQVKGETNDPWYQQQLFLEGLSSFTDFSDCYWEMYRAAPREDLVEFWKVLWRPFIDVVQRT